jgi:arylsulfatase A-like enzyme
VARRRCANNPRSNNAAPDVLDGIKQAPIEGTSFAYTFDKENADAPSRHKVHFEMMGQWALYDDGWLLSTKVNRAPWEAFGPANPDPLKVFELYDLTKDFSRERTATEASTEHHRRSHRVCLHAPDGWAAAG